jgi:Mlc titration factor MtfA (ptsG expression regulator)
MNKFIIFLLFILVSCSKEYKPISYLNSRLKPITTQRLPANINQNKCFVEEFGIERIRDDIAQMEIDWSKSVNVPKPYNKLKLKPAETHYIKKFHTYMFHNEESLSCTNLPCLLNIAYGDKESEAGERIYHWFLSMGTGISTIDNIPTYERNSFKEKTLKDFLFPVNELKLLNIVSKILSTKYKNLYISTLHRFPNGTSPGVSVAGMYNGFSGAYKKPYREIFLTSQSLSINSDKLVSGYYIHTLIHELTHALDFSFGDNSKILSSVSKEKDWTDLSWEWGEAKITVKKEVDGVMTEVEKTIMKWLPVEGRTNGFIRSYMKVSPAEDFADAGTYFVISPDELKTKAIDKYNKFKKDFYFDDSFRDSSEIDLIKQELNEYLSLNIKSIVKNCTLDKFEKNNIKNSLTLPSTLNVLEPNTRDCLTFNIKKIASSKVSELKSNRYKTCKIMKGNEIEFIQNALDFNQVNLEESFDKIGEIGIAKESWSSLRKDLKEKCDSTSVFLEVRNNTNPKEDYDFNLLACMDNIFNDYKSISYLVEDERKEFLEKNSYLNAEDATKRKFEAITKGLNTFLEIEAHKFLKSCNDYLSSESEMYSPISGGAIFVNRNVLNCLNTKIDESLDDVLKKFLEEKYNMSEIGLIYIKDSNLKNYINQINNALYELNLKEQRTFVNEVKSNINSVFKVTTSSSKLMKSYLDESLSFEEEFKSSISKTLQNYWNKIGNPSTISLNETISHLKQGVKNKLIKNANSKFNEEDIRLNVLNNELSKTLFDKYQDINNWEFKYNSIDDFKDSCFKSLNTDVEKFALSQKNEFNYLSTKKIKNITKDKICKRLREALDSELNDSISLKKSLKLKINEKIFSTVFWRLFTSEKELNLSCIKKITIDSQEKLNSSYKLLNIDLITENILKSQCSDFLKKWKTIDLKSIKKRISCSGDCSQGIPPLYKDLSKEEWNNYLSQALIVFSGKADLVFEAELKPMLNSCVLKYPQIRFSVMKIKRKKCLIDILEKDIVLSNLDRNSESSEIIKILLYKKINMLKSDLGIFMK